MGAGIYPANIIISKLPIRQLINGEKQVVSVNFSKLPIRQLIWVIGVVPHIGFSKLPIRQLMFLPIACENC